MESIKEWLDVEEVKRLAESLLRGQGQVLEPKSEAASPADNPVRLRAEKTLAEVSERAKRSGVVETRAVARPHQLPGLDTWLHGHSKVLGMCVVDRDGDVLHDSMPNPSWTRLAELTARSGLDEMTPAIFRQKVTADDYLQLIAIKTARGSLLIGLLTPVALTAHTLEAFKAEVKVLAAEV